MGHHFNANLVKIHMPVKKVSLVKMISLTTASTTMRM